MPSERPQPLRIPLSQVARQATDALEGYVYQLHQTVLAWLNSAPNELLHIEFAEDIAISDDGELRLTQVKRTSANTTLRSQGVIKLITSMWEFQSANPARRVSAALLTTSSIGSERGMSFPGDAPGLIYWRVAAREKSDVEPIRRALLALDLPSDLKSFVETATADELVVELSVRSGGSLVGPVRTS